MTHCGTLNARGSGLASDGCCAGATTRDALNGTATRKTKTMTEVVSDACGHARPRRPWAAIAIAVVAIASVVAGELWAFREAPALATTAKSEVVTDVDSTLASLVAASVLVAPGD